MWREILLEVLHWGSMILAMIAIRWIMCLSTPEQDMRTVSYACRAVLKKLSVSDWRDSFNMEKLDWLRRRFQFDREYDFAECSDVIIIESDTPQ